MRGYLVMAKAGERGPVDPWALGAGVYSGVVFYGGKDVGLFVLKVSRDANGGLAGQDYHVEIGETSAVLAKNPMRTRPFKLTTAAFGTKNMKPKARHYTTWRAATDALARVAGLE